MSLLLTGCAGFIGSHLLDRLLADGHRVIGVDNFDPFYSRVLKNRNIEAHLEHPNFQLVEGDLVDPATYSKIKFLAGTPPSRLAGSLPLAGEELDGSPPSEGGVVPPGRERGGPAPATGSSFDAIIHLAAKAGVRPSIEDPVGYQQANVVATQNLLEFAREQGIARFVFAGSSSVYGVNPNVPWSEDDAVLRPISPYASSKVSGELLGHVYSHLYGIRFLSLRFFTVYGPRQRPDLAIHKFARMIQEGKPIPVFGDGSTRRDYTYVADIVDGIVRALHYDKTAYEVINLGNDQTITLTRMIETIEAALGRKAIIDRQPEQPGDVPQTWANITKARQLLGYQPQTGFADGVGQFVKWLADLA